MHMMWLLAFKNKHLEGILFILHGRCSINMLKDWVRSWRHSFFPVDFDILHEQFCTKGEQSGNAAAPGGAVFQLCSVLASLPGFVCLLSAAGSFMPRGKRQIGWLGVLKECLLSDVSPGSSEWLETLAVYVDAFSEERRWGSQLCWPKCLALGRCSVKVNEWGGCACDVSSGDFSALVYHWIEVRVILAQLQRLCWSV